MKDAKNKGECRRLESRVSVRDSGTFEEHAQMLVYGRIVPLLTLRESDMIDLLEKRTVAIYQRVCRRIDELMD